MIFEIQKQGYCYELKKLYTMLPPCEVTAKLLQSCEWLIAFPLREKLLKTMEIMLAPLTVN
jgi:hypothetical protein